VDEMKILKRLARDANPQVRLRAVDLLISLRKDEKRACERCAADAEKSRDLDDELSRTTKEQREQLYSLLAQVKTLRAVARTQPVIQGATDV
jgi:hypothetical protein